jgi:hypothetical protein
VGYNDNTAISLSGDALAARAEPQRAAFMMNIKKFPVKTDMISERSQVYRTEKLFLFHINQPFWNY